MSNSLTETSPKSSDPSPSSAVAKPSNSQLLPELSAKQNSEIDTLIATFSKKVLDGVASWELAGKLIVGMKNSFKGSFERILQRVPWATPAMLETFYQIGMKQLCPKVLLIGDPIIGNIVMEMPYDDQVRACDVPIEVYQSTGKSTRLLTRDMSREQVKMVFSKDGIRTVAQQRDFSMFAKPKPLPLQTIPKIIPPEPKPEPEPEKSGIVCVIRKKVGGGFHVSETKARPPGIQKITLSDGVAVIEVID